VKDELKKMWMQAVVVRFKYYRGNCQETLRGKTSFESW